MVTISRSLHRSVSNNSQLLPCNFSRKESQKTSLTSGWNPGCYIDRRVACRLSWPFICQCIVTVRTPAMLAWWQSGLFFILIGCPSQQQIPTLHDSRWLCLDVINYTHAIHSRSLYFLDSCPCRLHTCNTHFIISLSLNDGIFKECYMYSK